MSIIDVAILRGWVTVDKTDGWKEQKRKYQREYYRKHHPVKPKKHDIQLDKNAFRTREDYYREYRKLLMRKVRAESKDCADPATAKNPSGCPICKALSHARKIGMEDKP